jgi:3-oxoacyl-[acyl-carrier-protein] synthase II
MPQSNVVITGLGVVSPIGIGCEPFFEAMMAARSGVRSLADRTDGHACPGSVSEPAGLWIGAPILDFDAKQYVRPRKALKVMCREIQLAFAASQLAIDHAGWSDRMPAESGGDVEPRDIGAVFGSEMLYGLPTEMEDVVKHCMRPDGSVDGSKFGGMAMRDVMPLWMLKYLPNMPACHVGIALNAQGPNNTLVLGDVSGPSAMIEAVSYLQRGIAKVMICGAQGTKINTTRLYHRGDLPIPAVADPVSRSSQPHVPTSIGVVGGEAAASMILELESEAAERGASPAARIRSSASRFSPSLGMKRAKRVCQTDAAAMRGSSHAIRLAIDAAIAEAGLSPENIGLIVSHAMGDPVIDVAEREALSGSMAEVPMVAPIASVGHTGAASGQLGIIVGAMALAKKTIPPTLNAAAAEAPLLSEPKPLSTDHVLCLAHNSEGNATAIILEAI